MIPLFITGHGAVTALGLDAARTVASLRGGLDGLKELPLAGVKGRDLRAVPVQGYAEGVVGPRRFEALASRALGECIKALHADEPQNPVVFLGLPVADRPDVDRGLEPFLKERLEQRFGLPRGAVRTIAEGRTSVFSALKQAEACLKSGARACIVGAVDSLLGPADLRAFSEAGVLAEEYDGFFPGEAAAFVCLSRRTAIGPWGRRAVAVIGLGEATEPADGSAEAPLVGVGMGAALRKALTDARIPQDGIRHYINSVNGTRSEFEDDAMGRIRFMRTSPTTRLSVWHLASYLGETGAAYGALALLWASSALELGIEPPSGGLLAAADRRRRAAVVLQPSGSGIMNEGAAPDVGLDEPVLHRLTPIAATPDLHDDPGMRLIGYDDRHRRLAEQDFDQLASLIIVRDGHLRSDSPWTDIDSFERRILAHLDAVIWSGDTSRTLIEKYLNGESEEAAAATFFLCCSPPRGEEIDLLLGACAQSDEHRARIAGTAALCPGGTAESFLLRLADVDGNSLRDALWALTIARWLTPEWVARAAKRLGRANPDLVVALGGLVTRSANPWPLDWLTSSGSPLPVEAALAGMVIEEPRTWLNAFRPADLLEAMPEALGIGHLVMKTSALAALGRNPAPTRGAMIAIGWSGESEGTSLLLDGLSSGDEVVADEAARALARIYGIRPIETVALPDDDGEAPAAGAPGAAAPAVKTDEESGPPPRKKDRLSQSRPQWEDELKAMPAASPQLRLRGGRPWSKQAAVEMLLSPKTPCSERLIANWEVAIVNRQRPPVHTRQWVAAQRRALGSLAAR